MQSTNKDTSSCSYMLANAYKHLYKAHKLMQETNSINHKVAGDFNSILSHLKYCITEKKLGLINND